ncbi:hypothetical protein PG994_012892 [Apiospora phragmitis]|uniref:Uncharacterized protein n=1 Tax=Apiospora phragmitis TaxID=2905665 RepID=A0ABR1T9A2_9PEZI
MLEHRFGYDDQSGDQSVAHLSEKELDDWRRWRRGTNNILRLQALERGNASAWMDFKSSLSQQQLLSWTLLTEWLNGDYHPKALAEAAQQAIYVGRPGPRRDDGMSLHPEFPRDAMIDQCVYHHQLSELYAAEFLNCFPDNESEVYAEYFLNLLETRRRSAFNFAVSQAISHASYSRWFGNPEDGTGLGISPDAQRPLHYPAPLLETREGELGRIAEREIGRQAVIFRGSAACLAWLNYIDDRKAEQCLIEWMSCQFLRLTVDPQFYELASSKQDDLWKESDKRPLHLTNHPFHVKYLGQGHLKGPEQTVALVSSLWTLQEACFCPPLTFMSRDLTPLVDASGKPISMERLSALAASVHQLMHQPESLNSDVQTPAVHRGLQSQYVPQNLDDALPIGASLLYNLMVENFFRQCKKMHWSAAEAIMSATGVLDWWDDPDVDKEAQLVLYMYPLALVKEAAQKFGPGFVLAHKKIGAPRHSLRYFFGGERGSMMPFEKRDQTKARGKRDVDMYPLSAQEDEWHPSFGRWEILQSGSVVIPQDSILGKKTLGRVWTHVPAQVFISWRETPDAKRDATMVGLQEWLAEQPAVCCTYAIMVSKSLGIILQGFSTPGLVRRKLIKTGCFEVRGNASFPDTDDWIESQDVSWAPEREVNWIVL